MKKTIAGLAHDTALVDVESLDGKPLLYIAHKLADLLNRPQHPPIHVRACVKILLAGVPDKFDSMYPSAVVLRVGLLKQVYTKLETQLDAATKQVIADFKILHQKMVMLCPETLLATPVDGEKNSFPIWRAKDEYSLFVGLSRQLAKLDIPGISCANYAQDLEPWVLKHGKHLKLKGDAIMLETPLLFVLNADKTGLDKAASVAQVLFMTGIDLTALINLSPDQPVDITTKRKFTYKNFDVIKDAIPSALASYVKKGEGPLTVSAMVRFVITTLKVEPKSKDDVIVIVEAFLKKETDKITFVKTLCARYQNETSTTGYSFGEEARETLYQALHPSNDTLPILPVWHEELAIVRRAYAQHVSDSLAPDINAIDRKIADSKPYQK